METASFRVTLSFDSEEWRWRDSQEALENALEWFEEATVGTNLYSAHISRAEVEKRAPWMLRMPINDDDQSLLAILSNRKNEQWSSLKEATFDLAIPTGVTSPEFRRGMIDMFSYYMNTYRMREAEGFTVVLE